jgi:hypothetical protein
MASRYSRSAGRRHAVVGQLVGVPAEPDPERHPPAGEVVQGGDGFRERNRIVLGGQRDGGAEPDPGRHRGRHAQRHPRVQRAHVAVIGQLGGAGARVRRLAPDRDVRVLGHVEAVEAGRLGRLRGLRRGDAAIAGEEHDAEAHHC